MQLAQRQSPSVTDDARDPNMLGEREQLLQVRAFMHGLAIKLDDKLFFLHTVAEQHHGLGLVVLARRPQQPLGAAFGIVQPLRPPARSRVSRDRGIHQLGALQAQALQALGGKIDDMQLPLGRMIETRSPSSGSRSMSRM